MFLGWLTAELSRRRVGWLGSAWRGIGAAVPVGPWQLFGPGRFWVGD